MTDSTTDKVELPTWADAFEGWLNKEDSGDREQLERAWATAIRWATYTRAQHVQSEEHADMPRRWCSVHGKEEFKYESYEHELKARDNYELGRHDERRLTMQLIGAVRMDTQTGGSGDVLDKLVMSIASHELPRYNAHVQSPSEQVRAAEAEIKAFAQELAETDLAYGFYDGEYVEKRVTEIITKHVHPASLTEAIEAVKRLRNKWESEDADFVFISVANEIITTLESLQGKAPVGESDELIALKRLLFCTRWFVKDCKDTLTMAAWEHAKQVIEKRAATTPSSGEGK